MRNPIDDAIAALRRGDQAKAFALLRGRLTQEPKDATAWLWMSEATPNIHRKIEALERFITLAPDHPRVPSARARLDYLESQVAKLPPESTPSIVIHNEKEEALDSPPPPVVPAPQVAPPTARAKAPSSVVPAPAPLPQRESLLTRTSRVEPDPTPPTIERPPMVSPPPMTVSTPPTRAGYQPAMPDLLQSLLDTAPMPRIRTDLPTGSPSLLDTAPRSVVIPSPLPAREEPPVTESEEIPATVTDEEVAPLSQIRATPRWAWVLMAFMAIQILLLIYIILRIELVLATVR